MTAFYRIVIASLLLALPFFRRSRAEAAPVWRKELLWAVLGGFLFAMGLIVWSTGVVLSGTTSPTLMANTAPLWAGLGSFLLSGERRGRRFWLGLALVPDHRLGGGDAVGTVGGHLFHRNGVDGLLFLLRQTGNSEESQAVLAGRLVKAQAIGHALAVTNCLPALPRLTFLCAKAGRTTRDSVQ